MKTVGMATSHADGDSLKCVVLSGFCQRPKPPTQ